MIFDRKHWNRDAVTEEQVRAIDSFFDSLFAGMKEDATMELQPSYITYGDLLQTLDTSRRWV